MTALSIGLIGCTGGDLADSSGFDECGAPAVELGDGEIAFNPLDEGARVTLVHGPQGGHHIVGSVQTNGLCQYITVEYELNWMERAIILGHGSATVATTQADCQGEYLGMLFYIDAQVLDGTVAEDLAEQQIEMRVDVTDTCENAAMDHLVVVGEADPADVK